MASRPDREADERLLDAIQDFVSHHPDPAVARFRDNVANWGGEWQPVEPRHLAASDTLSRMASMAVPSTRRLVDMFIAERGTRLWEQSYTKAMGLVGDDMLGGYGFAEVVGKRGPFMSERVRAGVGVWGPGIEYPIHDHQPEEVYVVLAGAMEFTFEGLPSSRRVAGEPVFVASGRRHGFRTTDEPLAVFYIWQGGDMRQTSRFEQR